MSAAITSRQCTILLATSQTHPPTLEGINAHRFVAPGPATSHLRALTEAGLVRPTGSGDQTQWIVTAAGQSLLDELQAVPPLHLEVAPHAA